jgi:tetratricopeptide (TPR) repeat protein
MKVAAALGLLLTLAPALAPAEPESAASDPSRLAAPTRPAADAAGAAPTMPATDAATAPALAPPNDLSDLDAWLDYQRHAHLAALPDESRLFYRRGLIAKRAGRDQEAIRLLRGATELDPSFVRPHLTLAAWFFTRDPSQALLRYAVVIDLVRRDFLLQIELVANLLFFTIHGCFVGLLATSLLIVLLRQAELRHSFEERLRHLVSPVSAQVWAWALLVVPFAAGVGVALPVVVWMGVLWPLLRARERAVHVALLIALLAAPFSGHLIGRLAAPLREDRGPLFGIATLQDEAGSPARQASLQRLATEHPDNPFVLFGLGWSARQSQDLATAETAYRRALALWPADARVLNNLANVLAVQGRLDPAIELYRRAIAADPACAAAQFNLSQAYTRQFEYRAASEAAARASALDFELVRNQQALSTEDGVLPLADQWIAPARFWRTVLDPDAASRIEPVLPVVWRGHIETSGVPFAGAVIVLGLGSLMVGRRWQRAMPLRPCCNCDRVVCRRCAQRRRELALCAACAEQESHAESPEFARMLLARQRARMERGRRLIRTTLAALLPGYGLLAFQRVFQGMFLIACAAQLAAPWLGVTAPFAYQTGPGLAEGTASPILALGASIAVYAASLLGFFSEAARAAARAAALAAPVRSRPSPVTQSTAKAA